MSISTAMQQGLVTLTIDGKVIQVPKGTTVYSAVKLLGIEIPIFCYQDRMPPFGACRVCLVEVEKMAKLQASCTLEATEGMIVKTQSALAIEGRKEILEFLLINHPLDCPICDRGGECPLQDQALKFGPEKSRFFEDKRHFKKPIPLGPVLMLDRERCIVCARCTRFSDIISGDHALEFIERGYRTEVGTPGGEAAESKFIGNTIMICPVGALTSQVYRFRARPWDNQPTESSCALCPVGCSLILDSRDGEIMRTRSNENREVNDMWLCDKGWFGYEFSSHPDRLKTPLIRQGGQLKPASWEAALSIIAAKIRKGKPSGKLAALGGNHLTVEENYLFQRLMREGAGVNHVDHRVGEPIIGLEEECLMPGMSMSIGECEKLSFALLLGIDLTEEFPVIWLRLKPAINEGADVVFLGHFAPEISHYFSKTLLHSPGQELMMIEKHVAEIIAREKKGAIFVGRQYLHTPQRRAILSRLMRLSQSSPNLKINILEGRSNSLGARFAGMRPDLGPFGQPLKNPGLDAMHIVKHAAREGWEFLYIAGANPAIKFPSKLWQDARAKLGFLVVQDMFLTKTAQQAEVVLPTLCFVEKEGSFINIEGRIQKLRPGKEIPEGVYSDAEIFKLLAQKLDLELTIDSQFLTEERPSFFHPEAAGAEIAQRPETQHNALAVTFAPALFDRGVRMKHNSHLVHMSKEPCIRIHPFEGEKRKITDGSRVRVSANGNSVRGKVKFDRKVAEKTVVVPLGFEQIPAHELGENLLNGLSVEIALE